MFLTLPPLSLDGDLHLLGTLSIYVIIIVQANEKPLQVHLSLKTRSML